MELKKKKIFPLMVALPTQANSYSKICSSIVLFLPEGWGGCCFFFFRFSTGTLSKSERTGRNPENCNINFAGLRPV